MNIELEAKRLEEWDNTPDIEELLDVITEGKILEIGCGTGRIIQDLSKHLKQSIFTGIDIKPYFIKKAQAKNIPKTQFMLSNALDRVFLEKSFDTIIFRDCLHQIHRISGKEGVRLALRNAFHYLKKGGKIVIRDAIKPHPKTIKLRLEKPLRALFHSFIEINEDTVKWSEKCGIISLDIGDFVFP